MSRVRSSSMRMIALLLALGAYGAYGAAYGSLVSAQAPSPASPAAPAAPPPAAAPAAPGAAPPAAAPADPAQPATPPAAAPTAPAEPAPSPAPPPPSYAPPTNQPTEPPPPPPEYAPLGQPSEEIKKGDWDPWEHVRQRRHDGFFLRLAIGLGGGVLGGDDHANESFDEVGVGGLGLATDIAIGGAIVENLILHADIYQVTLFSPTVYADDEDVGDADEVGDMLGVGQDVRLAGLGIGVTYYFMPVNLYLGGSIGLGQAVFEGDHGDTEGSELGFGFNALVGKEWWVGADWGIGLAGQLLVVSAKDDVLGNINGLAASVLFSATYN
jgi:hypothetical protein